MSALPASATVVIAGAGPAGLTVAITLASAGVDFVLLDRLAEGANTSRAAVIHARTLEVLDAIGVAKELCDKGIIVPRFTIRDRARVLATVDFGELPTPFPYTLMVPQDVTEAVLLARLRSTGHDVSRPCEITSVTDGNDGATVHYTGPGGAGAISARWVIGADGMHSTVRESAGIGFSGDTYASSFVLADVRMDWPIARNEVSLNLSPEGVTVVAPLPDTEQPNRYRIVATVAEAPANPDQADIQTILDTRTSAAPEDQPSAARVHDILWSSRFRVHHRVADRYRSGHLLVAGDAAHVHSPAGGQGMNTGIQDAAMLGPLLARLAAGAPGSEIDSYEATRRPVAVDVVSFTDRITRMATLKASPARAVRNAAMAQVTRIPKVRNTLAFRLAGLANR